MRQDRNDMLLILLYAVASSIVALSIPITVQAMVNTVAFGAVIQPIIVLALLVLGALTTAAIFRALQARVVETIQERVFARTALQLSHRLPHVDSSVFDDAHGPELANRFFDVLTVQKAGSTLLVDGSALALQTLVGMVVLAFYHPYLLAFDALLVLAMAFIFVGLGRGAERTAIVESKAKYAMAAWLQEMMRHSVLFKGTGGEEFAARRTYELTKKYLGARREHFRVLFRQIVGALGFQVIFSSLLIATGGFLVLQKQLTLGQLVAAEIIVSGVLASFSKVGKQLESLYDMLAGFDKLGHLLDLPQERGGTSRFPERLRGPASLAVKDVTFRYGGRNILSGASLQVNPGERVALLGPNGSGKSTMMNVLTGIYTPTAGEVKFENHSLAGLKSPQIAALGVARTFQNVQLFGELTLTENVLVGLQHTYKSGIFEIALGLPRALGDEAGARKRAAAILDFVGLAGLANEEARNLPYGKQRLLEIGRALALDPKLLLLDEPAAGLTAPDIKELIGIIRKIRDHGITVILIEHHMDVVMSICDTITVLDFGEKIAEGKAAEVQANPRVIEAYLGGAAATAV
ncbi:MAG: ATP-binding cassette domain-containing protein [Labilithrix sp.]|nr:ATP-binding cassette domain-containing protein [Labilithrix sp.]